MLSKFPNEKVYDLSCDEMISFFNKAIEEHLFINKYVSQQNKVKKENNHFDLKLTTKDNRVIM